MSSTISRNCVIAILILCLFTVSFAQTPQRQKKGIKDFGSSLKRLKWNAQKDPSAATPPKSQSTEVDEGDVIRTDTSLVSSELLVFDQNGKYVAGLTADDFLITENSEPQTVGHFQKGDNLDIPRTIVLVIDYSGSQLIYLKQSVAAAKVLVDKLGPNDLMGIVTDDVELLADFTADKKKLKDKLDSLVKRTKIDEGLFSTTKPRKGRSSQYSALMATLNEVFDQSDQRPIVIFQTDGDEAVFLRNPIVSHVVPPGLEGEDLAKAQKDVEELNKDVHKQVREFSLDDVYRTAERSRATVYTVIPGPKLLGFTPKEQMEKVRMDEQMRVAEMMASLPPEDRGKFMIGMALNRHVWTQNDGRHLAKLQTALAAVAPLTGGWTEHLERPEEADRIYARIFSDINQRYIVGYYPTNKDRDGKRRTMDFKVKGHPEYVVYGRRSYFAPGP